MPTSETEFDGSPRARGAVAPVALPDDYYVTSFLQVLDVVVTAHGSLLDTRERRWADAVREASDGARRLYIRLLARRGGVFRVGKLRYPEIEGGVREPKGGALDAAVAELVGCGLAGAAPPASLAGLLRCFTLPEIGRLLDCPPGLQKGRTARVRALLERDAPEDAARLAAADRWVAPLGHDVFSVFRLCFFGNLYQDLSEFVRRDVGTVRYESYPLSAGTRYFRTRAQLDAHLRFHECEIGFELASRRDAAALRALLGDLPERVGHDPHLERRLDRLRNAIARDLERLGLHEEALAVYRATRRAPARERTVRLLLALGRRDEALECCRALAAEDPSAAEAEFCARTLGKLTRRAVPPFRPASATLTLRRDGDVRVERAAREFYARDGACYWLENALVTSVLGLFAWDVIFTAIPGAFFHPFQAAPADYRERGFREARRDAFEARLAELDGEGASERLRERVMRTRARKHGRANPLVRWGSLGGKALTLALERIPCAHWRALFERMLDDPAEHTSGLPDLVRFPAAGGYELIEIKGPGDALQAHQRRWLRYFDQHGIPARVVNVRWVTERPRDVAVPVQGGTPSASDRPGEFSLEPRA